MKPSRLEEKLIAVARAHPPSDRVPYAFEKRVTALLLAHPAPDRWALWSRSLWRGAVLCLGVMLVLGGGSLWIHRDNANHGDLSQDFENTMLASANQDSESTW